MPAQPDAGRLAALIEPIVEGTGAELVDLQVTGSRGRPILRLFVDREGGVTLDACAALSRQVEAALEVAAAVPERYVLEVSSPGLERPLTKRAHFERFIGREISVRTARKLDGRRRFVGELERVEDTPDGYAIVVVAPEGRWTIPQVEIGRATLHVRW